MKSRKKLELDELMIVNPGSSGIEAYFLGDDGTLYQVQGIEQRAEEAGLGQFFLGADGTVYKMLGLTHNRSDGAPEVVGGSSGEDEGRDPGRFFLGEDGTLYEIVK